MLVLQGRLQAGEWVLVTGVSSGVGVSALQAAMTQQGANTVIDNGHGDIIVLANFNMATLTAADIALF